MIDYDNLLCDICIRRGRNKGKTKAQFILLEGEEGWHRNICHAHLNEAMMIVTRRLSKATLHVTVIKAQKELDELGFLQRTMKEGNNCV